MLIVNIEKFGGINYKIIDLPGHVTFYIIKHCEVHWQHLL